MFAAGIQENTNKTKGTVMCLPSNGVGLGHVTRLLAIARHLDCKTVFVSQSSAINVIREFGFAAEYTPSHKTVGGDFASWDAWYSFEIKRFLDLYQPMLAIFDGNHLTHGLIDAIKTHPNCRLAWVRRGMWAKTTSQFLSNAKHCDLIIEPGELAAVRDTGATSQLRDDCSVVDPIRLLEPEDLLDRSAAAQVLGLDPARPACLIQLGSGYGRDLVALIDKVIRDLRKHKGLQIAIAEWMAGSNSLDLWPGVPVIRGFPVNQYIRAFDFCVSAAGYNAFHELIGYGVPTIFVPNRAPTVDDQYARAKFAQDNAAAFEISENELDEFPALVGMMMQEAARTFLVEHCRKLERPNGAKKAAELLLQCAASAREYS